MLKNLSVKKLNFASAFALSTILVGITPSLAMMDDEEKTLPAPPQLHPYDHQEPATPAFHLSLLMPHAGGCDTLYTKTFYTKDLLGQEQIIQDINEEKTLPAPRRPQLHPYDHQTPTTPAYHLSLLMPHVGGWDILYTKTFYTRTF